MGSSSSKREPLRPSSATSMTSDRLGSRASIRSDRKSVLSVINEDAPMKSKVSIRDNEVTNPKLTNIFV